MEKCSVENCCNDVRVKSLGLCYKHYVRLKTHGSVEDKKHSHASIEQRFWRLVDKRSDDECWEWKGQILKGGYGRLSAGPKGGGAFLAHRLSWQLANKQEIPEKMVVMHKCDNPKCVNPNHLSLGTYMENTWDMISKGRAKHVVFFGTDNKRSILNPELVVEIRNSDLNHAAMARKIGVSVGCIRSVRSGRTWSHVK
jgi:hypothetical protein